MNDVYHVPTHNHLSCSLKDLMPGAMFVMDENKAIKTCLFIVVGIDGDEVAYIDVKFGNKWSSPDDTIVYPVDTRIEWDYAKTLGRLV